MAKTARVKAPKRIKKSKAEIKAWLVGKGYKAKPDKPGDSLDLIAEYHGINAEELRRMIT